MTDLLAVYGPHRESLTSAILADVLDALGHRHSALPAEVRPLKPGWKLFGRAATLSCVAVAAEPAHPYAVELECVDALKAGDVQPFRLAWSGGYLLWGDNLHCPRDPAIYRREHLLFSRIFDLRRGAFRCCHVPARQEDFWCNNTDTFNVWLDDDAPLTLHALLGILGSRRLGRWAVENFVNLQRQVFPKLSVRMVRSLPLPTRQMLARPAGAAAVRALDALVRQIVTDGLDGDRERRLEGLVEAVYELSPTGDKIGMWSEKVVDGTAGAELP